jgi:hypothetical protein
MFHLGKPLDCKARIFVKIKSLSYLIRCKKIDQIGEKMVKKNDFATVVTGAPHIFRNSDRPTRNPISKKQFFY